MREGFQNLRDAGKRITLAILLGSSLTVSVSAATAASAEPDDWGDDAWTQPESGFQWSGFIEALVGVRTNDNDALSSDATAAETRVRLETSRYWGSTFFALKADGWYDDVLDKPSAALVELSLAGQLGKSVDFKLGRFVSTWGTGDLLFLNDLFPKDWVSFFGGREMDYLKRPADSVKLGWYGDFVNVDVVWVPVFAPDDTITGERFSYFSPMQGEETAAPPKVVADKPDPVLSNGEFGLRLSKKINGMEWAAYFWRGFFKQPVGWEPSLGLPDYPKLTSVGGSLQGNLFDGVFNIETAWYQSREDSRGDNPFVPNDQLRFLIGYQQELISRLTGGVQWYAERTLDHDALIKNSANPQWEADDWRHVMSARVTHRAFRDNLVTSVMMFASPTDKDFFILPSVSYRFSDALSSELGARVFGGDDTYTFYGQHQDNSNVFVRIRARF